MEYILDQDWFLILVCMGAGSGANLYWSVAQEIIGWSEILRWDKTFRGQYRMIRRDAQAFTPRRPYLKDRTRRR